MLGQTPRAPFLIGAENKTRLARRGRGSRWISWPLPFLVRYLDRCYLDQGREGEGFIDSRGNRSIILVCVCVCARVYASIVSRGVIKRPFRSIIDGQF